MGGGLVGKRGTGGLAERTEDLGAKRFEFSPEIGFGAACSGVEGRETDGDGTGCQGLVGIPVRRGGDDDGTVELDGERLARVTSVAMEEGGGSWVGGDLPAGWRDFDDCSVGVGEIEQDGVGMAGMAAGGDASVDGQPRCVGEGASFKGADGLAERVIGGRLVVFAIEGVDEP